MLPKGCCEQLVPSFVGFCASSTVDIDVGNQQECRSDRAALLLDEVRGNGAGAAGGGKGGVRNLADCAAAATLAYSFVEMQQGMDAAVSSDKALPRRSVGASLGDEGKEMCPELLHAFACMGTVATADELATFLLQD